MALSACTHLNSLDKFLPNSEYNKAKKVVDNPSINPVEIGVLAVLPVTVKEGTVTQLMTAEELGDKITRELGQLSRIGQIKVVSRVSKDLFPVMQEFNLEKAGFVNITPKAVVDIGKLLGADSILVGYLEFAYYDSVKQTAQVALECRILSAHPQTAGQILWSAQGGVIATERLRKFLYLWRSANSQDMRQAMYEACSKVANKLTVELLVCMNKHNAK